MRPLPGVPAAGSATAGPPARVPSHSDNFIAVKPDYIKDVDQLRDKLRNANGKLNHHGWPDHRIFRNPTNL